MEVAGVTPWVQSVLVDRVGKVWVGSFQGRLQVLDQTGAHDIAPPELRTDNVLELFEDSRGRVWFSRGEDFVAEFDGKGFQKFGPKESPFKDSVMGFAEEVSGALWVASYKGVYRGDGERPFVEVKDISSRSIERTVGLKADQDGSMWLMTNDRGLLRWKNGKLASVGMEQGLPISSLRGIVEDETGHFWITSASKVIRVLQSELRAVADSRMARIDCQIFDANDGLPKGEFTRARQPNCVRDAQGRLWFAMTKGVISLDPGALRLNELPPPVHVEEISYLRTGVLGTNITGGRPVVGEERVYLTAPFAGQVSLPAGSHGIEIHYACLSFAAPEKVKTEVRLEGLEPTWRPAEGRGEQFRVLKPGRYLFRVRATNNDGVWNEAGESLGFSIAPYYWQTMSFRLGVGLFLISLGAVAAFGWSRSRIRQASEGERVARELADASQRMDLAAEAANLGMWMWDIPREKIWSTGKFRELFGFDDAEEISFDKIQDRIHPEDRQRRQETLQRALKTAGSYEVEYRVVRADGVERWIASKSRADSDNAGQPVRVVGVCIDITERRRTQMEMQNLRQELAHSGRVTMLGQLASALAHELSQPLGAILRNAEAAELFLQSPKPDLEELRNIITDIRKDDQRAGAVIERLRSLLKRQEIEIQSLDVGKLADEIVPLLRPDAVGRRISIELDKTPDLPLVRGDRVHLQQVLLNLVVNGMDAVANCEPDRRRVRLQVAPDGARFVAVVVSDFGHGIPATQLERVFEPFFTTKLQGMGFGLSISRTIVEAHGGRISATNNSEGGATFRFTVPVADGGSNGQAGRER
jgi:PAS domain S-box-containing protein